MKKLLLVVWCVLGVCGVALAQEEPAPQESAAGAACVDGMRDGQACFDSEQLFPTWNHDQGKSDVVGVIGDNGDNKKNINDPTDASKAPDRLLLNFLPRILDIIMKFVAPIVVIVFIWTGIRLIYSGSNDEELGKAKSMFEYAAIGLAFIVLSYTIMKIVYSLLAG